MGNSNNPTEYSNVPTSEYGNTLNLSGSQNLTDDMIRKILDDNPDIIHINLSNTNITSIDVLRGRGIRILNINHTKVSNISALNTCTSLHTVDLSYTDVNNIEALSHCQLLGYLNIDGTKVTDIRPLYKCNRLGRLYARNVNVHSTQFAHLLQLGHRWHKYYGTDVRNMITVL
jgi:Leucine-rich repeat (LRR) protein